MSICYNRTGAFLVAGIYLIEYDRGFVILLVNLLVRLTVVIQNIHGLFIWSREGVKWARDLVSVGKVGRCGLHEGSMLLPSNFLVSQFQKGANGITWSVDFYPLSDVHKRIWHFKNRNYFRP